MYGLQPTSGQGGTFILMSTPITCKDRQGAYHYVKEGRERGGGGQTFQDRKCIGRDGEPDLNASASGKSEEMSEWFVTSATTVGIHGLGRMSLQTLFTCGS